MRERWLIVAGILLAGASACDELDDPAPEQANEFATFFVTADCGESACSEDHPAPAGAAPLTLYLEAEARMTDGTVFTGFEREVRVVVQPGEIRPGITTTASLTAGRLARTPLEVSFAFGPTQIWIEDVLGGSPSYVTGVSQAPVWFETPRIRSVQECDPDSEAGCTASQGYLSSLEGRFVRLERHHDTGHLVVTHISTEGFFVTDTSEPDLAFASLYVYNHSRPEGLERGHRLSSLSGNVTEFYGLTELGFPSWEAWPCPERQVDGTEYTCRGLSDGGGPDDPEEYSETGAAVSCPAGRRCCPASTVLVDYAAPECAGGTCYVGECVPFDCAARACGADEICQAGECVVNPNLDPAATGPVLLDADRIGDSWEMEKLEGGLVRVERVTVLATGSDYETYGQWQVRLADGVTRITVVSQGAVPGFQADQETGACLNLSGNLRYHSVPKWIVYPRDAGDIERTTGCP